MLKENIQHQNGKGTHAQFYFPKKRAAHTVELVYWIVDIWALQIISPLISLLSATTATGILKDLTRTRTNFHPRVALKCCQQVSLISHKLKNFIKNLKFALC